VARQVAEAAAKAAEAAKAADLSSEAGKAEGGEPKPAKEEAAKGETKE
jgi:hypothetical protein